MDMQVLYIFTILPSFISSTYLKTGWSWNWKDTAIAVLQGTIKGKIIFEQLSHERCTLITGYIEGLNPNKKHGFHIHEYGDLANGCKAAGGHYNPFKQPHGGPGYYWRHVGDLGNIIANGNGRAKVHLCDKSVRLHNYPHVLGRSVVVHEREDDFGATNAADSKTSGNAGGRLGCGVIGLAGPKS